ncbi:hypothetical protein U1Q18_029791 [Sarracenia purpurea var. burkii]
MKSVVQQPPNKFATLQNLNYNKMSALTQTTTTHPPPQPRTFRRRPPTGAATQLAPRWVPRRGKVLKKILKILAFSCLCVPDQRQHSKGCSAVAPDSHTS